MPRVVIFRLQQSPSGQEFVSYRLTVEANDQQIPDECVRETSVTIVIERDRILPTLTSANMYACLLLVEKSSTVAVYMNHLS